MLERRITEEEVDYCLENYHTLYTDAAGNPIYRADLPSGRRIKVVLAAGTAEPRTVIRWPTSSQAREAGMEIEFDPKADAIYVHLLQKPYAHGVDLDDWRRVDYSADDEPIGVELLTVSRGVNVHQLPCSEAIARDLETRGIMAWRAEQYSFTESGYSETTFQLWPASLMPIEQHVSQVKEGVTA